jgi:REP element-mobilizing transposase RayT
MSLYRRNLPHIEEDGASYYVSFSTKQRLFLPKHARTLIFEHCSVENGRRVQMHAFVVMPDHVHMLFTPLEDGEGGLHRLAKIMNSIKGASSHSVNKLLERKGTLWEPESFDRILRTDDDFEFRLDYIVQNPVVAGLAAKPDDYRWLWQESPQPRAAALQKKC